MTYLIGSLRNPEIPKLAKRLRTAGLEVFAEWYGAGERADDSWQAYEKSQGRTLAEALEGPAAQNVFTFDKLWLSRADTVVLVAPAGRSGHLELGWALGQGKRGYVLFDHEPERWDIMLAFADGVFTEVERLIDRLHLDQVNGYSQW